MAVFVLDRHKRPLDPCTEKRARKMLEAGRARVHRVMPFVIRLVDRTVENSVVHPLVVKVDPGSKGTGIALVREVEQDGDAARDPHGPAAHVVAKFELRHRGGEIRDALKQRADRRRSRSRKRFREQRYDNRRRAEGILAPSLQHRVDTTTSTVERLCRLAPVARVDMELVRFDTQVMENPEVSGIEYQQGTLHGYEVREYVLEEWGRTCAYCDRENVRLQMEHVVPKARGGSNRVSNLVPSCGPCNVKKDDRPVEVFLKRQPERLARIMAQLRAPLCDAAAVNATRHALRRCLEAKGLSVTCWSGGRTKWNRTRNAMPKTHADDAACVGEVGTVTGWDRPTLVVRCAGRGSYQRQNVDRHGVARGAVKVRNVHGFRTGDHVKAVVPTGKHAGTWWGRVGIRSYGAFALKAGEVRRDVMPAHLRLIQRGGYGYALTKEDPPTRRRPEGAPPGPEGPGSRAGGQR